MDLDKVASSQNSVLYFGFSCLLVGIIFWSRAMFKLSFLLETDTYYVICCSRQLQQPLHKNSFWSVSSPTIIKASQRSTALGATSGINRSFISWVETFLSPGGAFFSDRKKCDQKLIDVIQ